MGEGYEYSSEDMSDSDIINVLEHVMKNRDSPTIALGKTDSGNFVAAAAWKENGRIVGAGTTPESNTGFTDIPGALADLFNRLDDVTNLGEMLGFD